MEGRQHLNFRHVSKCDLNSHNRSSWVALWNYLVKNLKDQFSIWEFWLPVICLHGGSVESEREEAAEARLSLCLPLTPTWRHCQSVLMPLVSNPVLSLLLVNYLLTVPSSGFSIPAAKEWQTLLFRTFLCGINAALFFPLGNQVLLLYSQ